MRQINAELAARGMNIAVEEIRFFTFGVARPANRILQQPFRWVPNDARRFAQGEDITYLVDPTLGATASGLSSAATEAAIDRALDTWDADRCLKKVDIDKRAYPGGDVTIFSSFFPPFPPFGDPGDDRVGNPWGTDIDLPGIDVETVALHENGHSLGTGSFRPTASGCYESGLCGNKPGSPCYRQSRGMCCLEIMAKAVS